MFLPISLWLGKPGGPRASNPRSHGKGIVEQCCVRGCDLQHLESYCAKPKRGRRHAPATLQQTVVRIQLCRQIYKARSTYFALLKSEIYCLLLNSHLE